MDASRAIEISLTPDEEVYVQVFDYAALSSKQTLIDHCRIQGRQWKRRPGLKGAAEGG